MEIPYSMACEKTPTMPLPRGGPGYCSATSTLSPSHAQSEGSRIPWREDSYHATARSVETSKLRVNCSIYRGGILGEIYGNPVFHGEKTPTMPLPRGGPGYCSATSTLSQPSVQGRGEGRLRLCSAS